MAGEKCYREGKVTRNAFFNYLRTLRKQYCGCTIIEIAVQGGKKWKQMSECEKKPFRDMVSSEIELQHIP